MLGLEVTLLGDWAGAEVPMKTTTKQAIRVRNIAETFQKMVKIRNRLIYVDKTIEPTVLGIFPVKSLIELVDSLLDFVSTRVKRWVILRGSGIGVVWYGVSLPALETPYSITGYFKGPESGCITFAHTARSCLASRKTNLMVHGTVTSGQKKSIMMMASVWIRKRHTKDS